MSISVRPYRPSDRQAFIALNVAWIEEFFDAIGQSDRDQLERVEETILAKGGHIVIAELNGEPIGTGAILPPHHDPGDGRKWLEIVKMAARADLRGHGIGRAVMDALIAIARDEGADAIWLETNASLTAAVALYERSGFRHLGESELWPTPYARCNVQMVLEL